MTIRTEYQREYKRKRRQEPEFLLRAAEIQRKHYKNLSNKKEKALVWRLKTRYGITPEQYKELFDRQEGCCAICGKSQSDLKMRLVLDHDHRTKEIRALLCHYCNLWIVGKLRKDTIQRIYDYLNKQYTGWFVPDRKKRKCKRKKRKKSKTVSG